MKVENAKSNKTNVFPNPALDYLFLNYNNNKERYQILNAMGQVLQEGVLCNPIDISSLSTDIYFFKTDYFIERFIKE